MAEPFVFHFRPDPHGHPEQMYIHDVLCGCGVCGHDQIQRFYHAISFHTLTLERLQALFDTSHQVANYECEHCGSPVGAQDVRVAVVRFAFADDAGEIVAYITDFGLVDGPRLSMQFFPGRRLDPQVQPRFEPEPEVSSHEVLSRALVAEHFGRPVSLKRQMRELWRAWDGEDDVLCMERVSQGFWVVIGSGGDDLVEEALALDAELAREDERDELEWFALDESEPLDLVTHARPEAISGAWHGWMPSEELEDGEVEVWCGVAPRAAEEILKRAFDVARLGYVLSEDEFGHSVFEAICSPRDHMYGEDVSVWSVLQRAVYTGISVGDAARLTAEEVVGVMLKVWKRALPGENESRG